eukprot:15410175-Alexandrium_andersonii.AAC.1
MHTRFKRSELELRGTRNGLNIDPGRSRGVHSARLVALIPNLTMTAAVLEVPRGFRRGAP